MGEKEPGKRGGRRRGGGGGEGGRRGEFQELSQEDLKLHNKQPNVNLLLQYNVKKA